MERQHKLGQKIKEPNIACKKHLMIKKITLNMQWAKIGPTKLGA
jgi:hypothetical protein